MATLSRVSGSNSCRSHSGLVSPWQAVAKLSMFSISRSPFITVEIKGFLKAVLKATPGWPRG